MARERCCLQLLLFLFASFICLLNAWLIFSTSMVICKCVLLFLFAIFSCFFNFGLIFSASMVICKCLLLFLFASFSCFFNVWMIFSASMVICKCVLLILFAIFRCFFNIWLIFLRFNGYLQLASVCWCFYLLVSDAFSIFGWFSSQCCNYLQVFQEVSTILYSGPVFLVAFFYILHYFDLVQLKPVLWIQIHWIWIRIQDFGPIWIRIRI